MTTITYQGSQRSRHSSFPLASLVNPVATVVKRLKDGWHRRQTERMLEGLAPDIRKDIGWPTVESMPVRK